MDNCIFCQIANKKIPTELVYEDERVVVFKDIHPKAPVHFLVVSKKHISSLSDLEESEKELGGELLLVAKKIAKEQNLNGYKIVINVGREGGQIVEHLHVHILSGRPLQMP